MCVCVRQCDSVGYVEIVDDGCGCGVDEAKRWLEKGKWGLWRQGVNGK